MGFGDDGEPQAVAKRTDLEETEEMLRRQARQQDMVNAHLGHTTDTAHQVRQAIWGTPIPKQAEMLDFDAFFDHCLHAASRFPFINSKEKNDFCRDLEDLRDRASSQMRSAVVRSKMQKFLYKHAIVVSVGDMEGKGMTGISALITSSQVSKQDQTLRTPNQPSSTVGLFDGIKAYLGRGTPPK
jgi:hypothetical protein